MTSTVLGSIRSSCHAMLGRCHDRPCLHGGTCQEGWNRSDFLSPQRNKIVFFVILYDAIHFLWVTVMRLIMSRGRLTFIKWPKETSKRLISQNVKSSWTTASPINKPSLVLISEAWREVQHFWEDQNLLNIKSRKINLRMLWYCDRHPRKCYFWSSCFFK